MLITGAALGGHPSVFHTGSDQSSVRRELQTILAEGSNQVQIPGHQLVYPEPTHVMAPYWEEVGIAIKTAAFPENLLPTSDLSWFQLG